MGPGEEIDFEFEFKVGRETLYWKANQGERGKDDSRDCPDSSELNGKDPVDGDPHTGDKPIDPDGKNGESCAGDRPR